MRHGRTRVAQGRRVLSVSGDPAALGWGCLNGNTGQANTNVQRRMENQTMIFLSLPLKLAKPNSQSVKC